MAFFYWSVIYVALFVCIVASFPQATKITLISVDKTKATLQIIKTGDSSAPGSIPCTLHYKETGGHEDKYVQLTTDKFQETVTLTGLQTGTSYTATLQCYSNKSVVIFKTVSADDDEVKETPDEAVYKDKQLFSATTLDIVLGVLFGIVALVIVVVTLLYLYRKHQRRQRLRNFLSTPHTDPFESLQDYVE